MCIRVLFIALADGKDFKCENPTDSCQHGAIVHKNVKNQEPSFPIFLSLQTMPNRFTVVFSSDLHSSVPKRLL